MTSCIAANKTWIVVVIVIVIAMLSLPLRMYRFGNLIFRGMEALLGKSKSKVQNLNRSQ